MLEPSTHVVEKDERSHPSRAVGMMMFGHTEWQYTLCNVREREARAQRRPAPTIVVHVGVHGSDRNRVVVEQQCNICGGNGTQHSEHSKKTQGNTAGLDTKPQNTHMCTPCYDQS